MPRKSAAAASPTNTLATLLAQYSFSPVRKANLTDEDMYVEGDRLLTVKARTTLLPAAKSDKDPRPPSQHTNAVLDTDGKISMDVFEDAGQMVVLVKPRA